MKAGWEIKTLDEVCIVERGSSPRPIKEFFTTEPDGVNWIKIGDTEEGGKYVFSTAQKITPEGAKQSRYVKEGDFILTNSMSFGRPYIMKTDGYIHDGWFVLRLKDSIDTDYFYHLLSSDLLQEQFTRLAAGAIVKNISGDLVKKAVLPIAPLHEQKRIVAILDEAFESIATAKANAEQNLKNARALFESHLNEVFTKRGVGWEEKTLGEVCTFENGDRGENYPSKAIQTTSGIPFINAGHLSEDGIDFEKMNYIPRERFNLLGNGKIRQNDILFCLRGSLGKFASVGELSEGAIASSLVIVRPKETVLNEFVLFYFQSDLCAKMIDDFRNGAAQPNLSAGNLKIFLIPVPSYSEQKHISYELKQLKLENQRLESIYQRKLAALEELKKALLHRAFSGEL